MEKTARAGKIAKKISDILHKEITLQGVKDVGKKTLAPLIAGAMIYGAVPQKADALMVGYNSLSENEFSLGIQNDDNFVYDRIVMQVPLNDTKYIGTEYNGNGFKSPGYSWDGSVNSLNKDGLANIEFTNGNLYKKSSWCFWNIY